MTIPALRTHIDFDLPPKFKGLWEDSRYKILYGGRGGAKTHAVAAYLVVQSLLSNKRILCTREIQKSIKESVHQVLENKINALGLKRYFSVGENKIVSVTGSEFIFAGLRTNIDSIKSLESVDICWVEEAQSISRNSLDVLRPTIRKAGSQLIFTFNPKNESDPVYNDFVVNCPAGAWVQKVNYSDNPFFPMELEAERQDCLVNNSGDYGWIWEGECRKISDAQVFKGVYEVREFDTPPHVRFYHGTDWGYAEDPATLVRCFIDKGFLYIDGECYGKGVDLDDLPRFFTQVATAKKWPIYGDAARPDIITHLKRRGFNIKKCDKWAGSIDAGIAYIRNFYKVIIHPRCVHTLEEFERYAYKQDRLTNEILPVPLDKWNHCIDALRYALTKRIKKGIDINVE